MEKNSSSGSITLWISRDSICFAKTLKAQKLRLYNALGVRYLRLARTEEQRVNIENLSEYANGKIHPLVVNAYLNLADLKEKERENEMVKEYKSKTLRIYSVLRVKCISSMN